MQTFPHNLDEEETEVLKKVLTSTEFQNLIGAEEWDLSESEEFVLWDVIAKAQGTKSSIEQKT